MKRLVLSTLLFLLLYNGFSQRNNSLNEKSKESQAEKKELKDDKDRPESEEDPQLSSSLFKYIFIATFGYADIKINDGIYYPLKLESDVSIGTAGNNYTIINWRTEAQLGLYSIDYRKYSTFEKFEGEYHKFGTDDIQFLEINPLNTKNFRFQAGIGTSIIQGYDLSPLEFTLGLRYYFNPGLYLETEYRQTSKLSDVVFRREININAKYRPFDKLRFIQFNLNAFYARYYEIENFYGIYGGVGVNFDGWKKGSKS